MLVDASPKEFMEYSYEIKINCMPLEIPELAMLMNDFSVKLG